MDGPKAQLAAARLPRLALRLLVLAALGLAIFHFLVSNSLLSQEDLKQLKPNIPIALDIPVDVPEPIPVPTTLSPVLPPSPHIWCLPANFLVQAVFDEKSLVLKLDGAHFPPKAKRLVAPLMSQDLITDSRLNAQAYKHFINDSQHYDRIEDSIEFVLWENSSCSDDLPTFLLSPWAEDNSFHLLNDNLLPIFINRVIGEFQENPSGGVENSLFLKPARIFLFPSWNRKKPGILSLKLLKRIFSHVEEFSSLASRSSPSCYRRLRYGRGPLLFYSEPPRSSPLSEIFFSLENAGQLVAFADKFRPLRPSLMPPTCKSSYQSIQMDSHNVNSLYFGGAPAFQAEILSGLKIPFYSRGKFSAALKEVFSPIWANFLSRIPSEASEDFFPRRPKILFIDRPPSPSGRFIKDLQPMKEEFRKAYGLNMTVCCQWSSEGLSEESFLSLVHRQDILIGLHGAGLANAAFMAPGGMLVELQSHYGANLFLFSSVSRHLVHHYLPIDIQSMGGFTGGYSIEGDRATTIVEKIMKEWGKWSEGFQ